MGKWSKILKWVLPILGVMAALAVFGYLRFFTWNPERQKLAAINDRQITVAQFGREVAKIPSPYQDIIKEEPKEFLDQIILKEVLLQEGRRLGLKSDPGTKGEEADLSLIQNLFKKEILDKVKVSQEEVAELYKKHRTQLGEKSLNDVAPLIENAIREAKGKDELEKYVVSLKQKAKIEVNEKRLQKVAVTPPVTNTSEDFRKAMLSGKPALVDFGANSCVPCRQIRPLLKEIGKEYTGKAHVLILDIYKYKDLAGEYRVQVLPTLIFFDKSGKEFYRHLGSWDKNSIVNKLKEAGAA